MEKTFFEKIIEFHVKFGLLKPHNALLLDETTCEYRYNFLVEELTEFKKATLEVDISEFIDALVDLSYVAIGTAYMHGDNWDFTDSILNLNTNHIPPNPDLFAFIPEEKVCEKLHNMVLNFVDAYKVSNSKGDLRGAIVALHAIHDLSMVFAIGNCFDWQAHWDEVHNRNMLKVRSSSSSDPRSKRKNSLDVVKPLGWTGPDHQKILKTHPHYSKVQPL